MEETRGGARQGSGRREVLDKKEQTYLYIRGSIIKALGGKSKVHEIMEKAVMDEYEKIKGTQS